MGMMQKANTPFKDHSVIALSPPPPAPLPNHAHIRFHKKATRNIIPQRKKTRLETCAQYELGVGLHIGRARSTRFQPLTRGLIRRLHCISVRVGPFGAHGIIALVVHGDLLTAGFDDCATIAISTIVLDARG